MSETGTGQGRIISPLLADVYLAPAMAVAVMPAHGADTCFDRDRFAKSDRAVLKIFALPYS